MATNNNLTDLLTDVADAIRAQEGSSELINPQNFSTKIRNLPSGSGPDMSLADATPGDVIMGKTFYAGNTTLKTGTYNAPAVSMANASPEDVIAGKTFYAQDTTLKTGTFDYIRLCKAVYLYTTGQISISGNTDLYMPDGTTLPKYFAYNNKHAVTMYFNSNTTIIPTYCFYGASNFYFPNFVQSNIKQLDSYAFYLGNPLAFDYQHWPSTLKTIESRAFQEIIPDRTSIIMPQNLERLGIWSFCSTLHMQIFDTLSIPSYNYSTLPNGCFYWSHFNCDFRPPSVVTEIGSQFNSRGSFNNVTIPATVTRINDTAFGSTTTDAVAEFNNFSSFTFLGTSLPVLGNDIIAPQALQTPGFKIYVPDSAVATYKASSKLTQYASYIVGESERPTYTITLNLTNCTGDNSATSIQHGFTYRNKITPDTGYTLTGATVSILDANNNELKDNYYCNNSFYTVWNGSRIALPTLNSNITINITAVSVS